MSSTFVDYVVHDLLDGVEGVRARAMFGGHGIYKNDTMFAIIVDDELYYKANAQTQKDFKALGGEPFRYSRKDKGAVTMSYWKVPAEIMDDRRSLLEWTGRAVRTALLSARKKQPKRAASPKK